MSRSTHAVPRPRRAAARRAAAALVAAGAVALLAGPASAVAATVKYVPTAGGKHHITYVAGPLEDNNLQITQDVFQGVTRYTFDDVVPVTIGGGPCFRSPTGDETVVTCSPVQLPGAKFDRAIVDLDDGTNSLFHDSSLPLTASANEATKNTFRGGSGNDTLHGSLTGDDFLSGGAGDDGLFGQAGADEILPGPGNDTVFGGDGSDHLRTGPGHDAMSGGPGVDLVDYVGYLVPVKVTIDNVANDGADGEGDNVKADVEEVKGGHGNDELIDLAGAGNGIYGGPGDDTLDGGAGSDATLAGGAGNDTIMGGTDNDMLFGGPGHDTLEGESGRDLVAGEQDVDLLVGGPGPDSLQGGTGIDRVSYESSLLPVTVDLDGASGDDGIIGEGDSVGADVEGITGGPGADRLTGNASANSIAGLDGNDVIDGGLAADSLFGGNDSDTLRSNDGAADTSVHCGAGQDQLDADSADSPFECESPAAPAVGIGPKRARIDRHGRIKLQLHCWATSAERCTGTLKLKRQARTVASRSFTIASGATAKVRVPLAREARPAAGKKLRVQALTWTRDASGREWTSQRALTLSR